jgi:hypothetical protein
LKFKLLVFFAIVLAGLFFLQNSSAQADPMAQIPTVSIPTVTGTPIGAVATVRSTGEADQVNVRNGPGTEANGYQIVGVLIVGQQVPALGMSPGGDWIQIAYPGAPGGVAWVWEPLVDVQGNLPIVEPPPTPTPRVTPTIDPTLAAQFLVEVPPTRLPTFTPAPPITYPTFPVQSGAATTGRVPMGLLVIGMAVVGMFGTLISILRGR